MASLKKQRKAVEAKIDKTKHYTIAEAAQLMKDIN